MKKLTKIFAVLVALMLMAISLVACAAGTEYIFEAEEAELDAACQVESGPEYSTDPEAEEVEATHVGYFTAEGTTITWTIVSDKACNATLTLRASSTNTDMWTVLGPAMAPGGAPTSDVVTFEEVDLSKNECVVLTVNGKEVSMSGILPGLELNIAEHGGVWGMFGIMGPVYKNYGTGTAKIRLQKGENKIVLTAQGYNDGQGGINVDKIMITANATLTWEPQVNG